MKLAAESQEEEEKHLAMRYSKTKALGDGAGGEGVDEQRAYFGGEIA